MAKLDLTEQNHQLLKAMAQELRLPLLQIARQAELGLNGDNSVQAVRASANQALWLVDTYLLSQHFGQAALPLEPVTISSVLDDAAHDLDGLAKQYSCSLQLELGGRLGPVMANRQALRAVLVGLGSSLIGASSSNKAGKPQIILSSYRTKKGVVAGVYSQTDGLSQALFKQAGATIYMANQLLDGMDSQLRLAKRRQLTGLAATLLPSQQLALV